MQFKDLMIDQFVESHNLNPTTWEEERGASLWVGGQTLYRQSFNAARTLTQREKKKKTASAAAQTKSRKLIIRRKEAEFGHVY